MSAGTGSEVTFPRLKQSEPDAEGMLATWLVADGDRVRAGQLLGEVMVDKVSAELTAPVTGTVRLLVGEGEVTRQGQPIARIE